MNEQLEIDWRIIQDTINACIVCKDDRALFPVNPPPIRPWNPGLPGRLLFVSEAPPESGGFWHVESEDHLRRNILELLGLAGLRLPAKPYKQEALQNFLNANFFLIQTIKWPIQKGSFNKLGPAEKRRLVEHSVMHLEREIGLISPTGILAMGNAAWDACLKLNCGNHPLPDAGVETVRGKDYKIELKQGLVPLNVTFLPVNQNMNRSEQRSHILVDLAHFLNLHQWYCSRNVS
jgi:uracil-DNA glycosylase